VNVITDILLYTVFVYRSCALLDIMIIKMIILTIN
jgi:hypothetical protein